MFYHELLATESWKLNRRLRRKQWVPAQTNAGEIFLIALVLLSYFLVSEFQIFQQFLMVFTTWKNKKIGEQM